MNLGGRDVESLGQVVGCAGADVADAGLNRVQCGQEFVARNFGAQFAVDGGLFVGGGSVGGQVKVHSILLEFFDANRGGFEFRGARFRVHCVDGQVVGGHLIVKMHGQKCQTAAESRIEANRSHHGTAARQHAHFFAFAKMVARAVLGRKIESLLVPER